MGISLANTTPSSSFDSLIKFGDNDGATNSLKRLSDGNGNDLPISISTLTVYMTGSLYGSSSYASTASYVANALSASYVKTAQTASYVLNAISANNASTASYVLNAISASYAATASFSPWTNSGITFTNSGNNTWSNTGGVYGKLHYRKDGDLIHFSGVISNSALGTPTHSYPFTIPASIAPSYNTQVLGWDNTNTNVARILFYTASGGTATVEIFPNTALVVFLDGISYKTNTNTY